MSKLIINRKSEWNNRGRIIGIYVDGEKIGTIENGETVEFDVDHGKYEIFAKVDWCRSSKIELAIKEDEEINLTLSGFKYSTWLYPSILGIMLFYYVMKHALNIELDFLIWIALIAFLYPLYFITFGRHRYLILSET